MSKQLRRKCYVRKVRDLWENNPRIWWLYADQINSATHSLSGLVNELGLHDGNVEALSNGVNELFQQVASISTSIEVGLTLNFLVR